MNYRKINKPIARKMYKCGCTILLLPCKVNEIALTAEFSWIKPVSINIKECSYDYNKFDRTVCDFEIYNCNSEVGYYPHYFVSEEDIKIYETLIKK